MENSKFLIVGSTEKQIGKTVFILGLAKLLIEKGYKVGYFKPLDQRMYVPESKECGDADACIMKEKLNLPDSVQKITPYLYHREFIHKILTAGKIKDVRDYVKEVAEEIAKDKDIVLTEGLDYLWTGMSLGLSAVDLSNLLNAPLITLINYDPVYILDSIKLVECIVGNYKVNHLGTVIIGAKAEKDIEFKEYLLLEEELKGTKVLGTIPSIRELIPITPREIAEATDARIIVGEEWLDKPIENFLIGAMTPEKALRYLRITADKAVITGGDRTDILLAALETPTSALILTGNIYPDEHVITKAEERQVPVLLTPYDTYTTMRKIEESGYSVKSMQNSKIINLAKEIEKRIDVDRILSELNLK